MNLIAHQNPFDPALYGGVQFDHGGEITKLDDGAMKVRWRKKGNNYGPVYQGQTMIEGCVGCGSGNRRKKTHEIPKGPFIRKIENSIGYINLEIHTLRFGNPDWMQECAPTLDSWCARHAIPLKITSTWDESYPDPKFCEVDMLRKFLAGEADWMMYMDADIVVHPLAPRPYFEDSGFYIRFDRYNYIPDQRAKWVKWCHDRFGENPADDWIYRNAGVWVCDRESAKSLLDIIEKPYYPGIMEQHHFNWWLHLAKERGMPVIDLPSEWNRIPEELEPAWFFHIYSKIKFQNLKTFREEGLLPDKVTTFRLGKKAPDFGKCAVVWPWDSKQAEWDEMWHSGQSVRKHWKEQGWPLVIFGDRKPDWWQGEFVLAPSYEEAISQAVQCADQVILMNDDIFMLADQSLSDFKTARFSKDLKGELGSLIHWPHSWRRGLGQVLMRCHHHGRTAYDFSTHTPYLFEREKAREVLEVFGCFHKIPFESAYHNWHKTPHAKLTEKAESPTQLAGKLWVELKRGAATPEFKAEMVKRHGRPSLGFRE